MKYNYNYKLDIIICYTFLIMHVEKNNYVGIPWRIFTDQLEKYSFAVGLATQLAMIENIF